MTRLIAWFGLCGVCTVLSLAWWPFGLIPAAVLLAFGTLALVDGQVRRRDVIDYADTDWRQLAAWLLLAGAVTVSLYFVGSKVIEKTVTRTRGQPCVDASKRKGLQPSKGCDRLAQLLLRTCVIRPRVCREAQAAPRVALSPRERRALDQLVSQLARERAQRRAAQRRMIRDRRRHRDRRRADGPAVAPRPAVPVPGGGGGAPGAPGGGGSGGGGGSPPARPSPSDAVNRTKDRVRDSANDAAQAVGAGRPVPALPDVPQTPVLPCIPVPPLLPC